MTTSPVYQFCIKLLNSWTRSTYIPQGGGNMLLGNFITRFWITLTNSALGIGLYYGFLTTFSIRPSYLFLFVEDPDQKAAAITGFIMGLKIFLVIACLGRFAHTRPVLASPKPRRWTRNSDVYIISQPTITTNLDSPPFCWPEKVQPIHKISDEEMEAYLAKLREEGRRKMEAKAQTSTEDETSTENEKPRRKKRPSKKRRDENIELLRYLKKNNLKLVTSDYNVVLKQDPNIKLRQLEGEEYWIARDWPLGIRGILIIKNALFRKYITLPLAIIAKNIGRILLLQRPEWAEDRQAWENERYIVCDENAIYPDYDHPHVLSLKNLPNLNLNKLMPQWWEFGCEVLIQKPLELKPWHTASAKRRTKRNAFVRPTWGLSDHPWGPRNPSIFWEPILNHLIKISKPLGHLIKDKFRINIRIEISINIPNEKQNKPD
uniref:Protein TIC 214 n=1 Tax=Porterella carnosula TaxID=101774 RepID=A0A1L6BVS8_9ASTR|nr:hypothetical protein Po_car1Pt1124 [Porterella carnosula]APQ40122.1 hypothetical protein Po_car1Pt1124 [Porterella carnosula]